ncbi:MAG: hypothetical protein IKG18_10530 [Atopobiaceae bacterium]|nr:hypothetical protein [Atopobiaceae bacterium]
MSVKTYYRIEFETLSALSIGATDSDVTDHDMVLDSRGLPLIPGTSLAGAYRDLFYDRNTSDNTLAESECIRIFGDLETGDSALRVYDATFEGGNDTVTIRDNVSLKDKVAVPGLKFDRQIVERGACFVAYLEIPHTPTDDDSTGCTQEDVERIVTGLDDGTITLGAKTTRGLGRVRVMDCRMRNFALPQEKDAWLAFDMFGSVAEHWNPNTGEVDVLISTDEQGNKSTKLLSQPKDSLILKLALTLRGGVSVREYTTEVEKADFSQLVVHTNAEADNPTPVIPGTSWAGAIRTRYAQLAKLLQLPDDATTSLFGFVGKVSDGKTTTQRSRISFSESVIEGGEWITYTRNAVDRITGGTIPKALFTERSYYGGTTELVISIDRPSDLNVRILEPLLATLADLHNGFLAVGGLTAVGRGLFHIDRTQSSVALPGKPIEESRATSTRFFEELLAEGSGGLVQPDIRKLSTMLMGGEVA